MAQHLLLSDGDVSSFFKKAARGYRGMSGDDRRADGVLKPFAYG